MPELQSINQPKKVQMKAT